MTERAMGLLCVAALMGCATTGAPETGEAPATALGADPQGPGCDPDTFAWACDLVPTGERHWPQVMEILRTTAGPWRQLFASLAGARLDRVFVRNAEGELVTELELDARGRVTWIRQTDSTVELRWDEDGIVGAVHTTGPDRSTRSFVAEGPHQCHAVHRRVEPAAEPVRYVCAVDGYRTTRWFEGHGRPETTSEQDGERVRTQSTGQVEELRLDERGRTASRVVTIGRHDRTSREVERSDDRIEVRTRHDGGAISWIDREIIQLGPNGLPVRVERAGVVFQFEYRAR